jgi:DNA repair protein RadC
MTIMVRDLPEEERPREKLLAKGAAFLSDVELLAVLLRTGTRTESVLHLAEAVLSKYKDKGLISVVHMSPEEFAEIKGIGSAKAATVLAAVELGRRISVRAAEKREAIHAPEDAAAYAMPHFRYERKEHFAVLLLNTKNHVLDMPIVSTGSLSASVVHPREVFQAAIRQSAAAMILIHNHPSGYLLLTQKLIKKYMRFFIFKFHMVNDLSPKQLFALAG